VRLGPLVVEARRQERATVERQRLLEATPRCLALAGPRAGTAPLAGRPEAIHVYVDGQQRIEAVLTVSVQHGLVATARAAAAQGAPQRVNRHLETVGTGVRLGVRPERLN
jgi:hypothetical protein